jgi:PAS domain S-box-containing protein
MLFHCPLSSAVLRAFLALTLLTIAVSASAKTIRAGLEQNPPLSYIDDSGTPSGLLVDLLDAIAAKEGWQVEYIPDTFKNCLKKLDDHEIDLMVTIAWSEQRAKRYDFNQVNVVAVWGALYTPTEIEIESFFELEGKTIATMRKDIHYQALRKMLKNFGIEVQYLEVDNFDAVFTALRDRKADAGVVGRFYAIGKEETYNVHASPLIFNPIRVHYATAKGTHADLLQKIDQNLETLKKDRSSLYYESLERQLGVVHRIENATWLAPVLMIVAVILVLMLTFILLLKGQVKARTKHLESEIAERTRTAKALQLSEQNYRELVENANAIILRCNLQAEITFVNDFAERFFGYMKEELIGQKIVGTIVPAQASDGSDLAMMMENICQAPEEYTLNINENICKNGDRVWIFWNNRPIFEDEQFVGILSVGQDFTEQIRAEQKQLQLDQAKNSFISTAAHELRTPLTSIIGYAELLRDHKEISLNAEQQHEFHSEICEKGYFLARIIDDLFDISRIQEGKPLPLHRYDNDLVGLVTRIHSQYQTLNPEHNFSLDISTTNPPNLKFDRDRITQILENLLNNAVKYSEPGSSINTTITSTNDQVRVTISDQGIGMSEEEATHIFDNFYRADQSDTSIGGLGLGMSIVKQIIDSHNGSIEVESAINQGTRISFTLPA